MRLITVLFICFIVTSCVKDKPNSPVPQEVRLSSARKVYIVNEGNFGSGKGTVSLYDPASNTVTEDLYKTQNNLLMGDIAQSLTVINGKYYTVINNSGKIIVCNQDFKKHSEITGLTSPRYILPVSQQKAYVSDLKANGIHILNLSTHSKLGFINCPGWTENMAMIYNKVYVTNLRKNFLYVIDATTDKIVDSIATGLNCRSVLVDANDKIWVLSSGDDEKLVSARLMKIDAQANKVELTLPITGYSAAHLRMNQTKDTLYFLNQHVFRMSVKDQSPPVTPLINNLTRNFYSMAVSPWDGKVYVSDALDYSQRSNIYVYDRQGNETTFFKAGVIATDFYFE